MFSGGRSFIRINASYPEHYFRPPNAHANLFFSWHHATRPAAYCFNTGSWQHVGRDRFFTRVHTSYQEQYFQPTNTKDNPFSRSDHTTQPTAHHANSPTWRQAEAPGFTRGNNSSRTASSAQKTHTADQSYDSTQPSADHANSTTWTRAEAAGSARANNASRTASSAQKTHTADQSYDSAQPTDHSLEIKRFVDLSVDGCKNLIKITCDDKKLNITEDELREGLKQHLQSAVKQSLASRELDLSSSFRPLTEFLAIEYKSFFKKYGWGNSSTNHRNSSRSVEDKILTKAKQEIITKFKEIFNRDLTNGASEKEIHRVYKKLSLACHPDKKGGDKEFFQQLQFAEKLLVKEHVK
jgi:hypothetical protein